MIWKKITIETTTEAVDMISYTLGELGVEGIQVEDKVPLSEEDKKAMFIDILPELPPDDGVAYISCYVDDPNRDVDELVGQIKEELQDISSYMNIGSGTITLGETDEKDWVDNWKEFFHPFWLDRILIKPTWIPEEDVERHPDDLMIEIDPGTAFGTGGHETTQLCIQMLETYMQDRQKVLDVGCGSGILSIIASKLGAGYVRGIDIDELAVEASYENCRVNHIRTDRGCENPDFPDQTMAAIKESKVSVQASFEQGDVIGSDEYIQKLLAEHKKYDIIVANILADVIIPLSAVIGPFMHPDSIFISSGIIHTKADEVRQALIRNHYDILEERHMNDWVAFAAVLHYAREDYR